MLHKVYAKFENGFFLNFRYSSPMLAEELKEVYSDAKNLALEVFNKFTVGITSTRLL